MTQEKEVKLAESKGFKCIPDEDRGDNWKKFIKDNLWVWAIILGGQLKWQTAIKNKDNYFIEHRSFYSLEEALNRGTDVPSKNNIESN